MRALAALLAALLLLAMPVAATEAMNTEALRGALPSEAQEHLGELSPADIDTQSAALRLGERALGLARRYLRDAMSTGFMMLALCALLALCTGFSKGAGLHVPEKVMDMTVVCAILAITLGRSGSVIAECAAAIEGMGTFSDILIPAFGVATALSGRPVTAVAAAGATMVFSRVILLAAGGIFIPVLYLYITVCGVGALSEDGLMSRVAGFIKWLSTTFFRGFLMVFTGYLSLSGVISGSADVVAVKTAQVTISSAVPVVGGIISGVSETLLSGANLLRSSIGVFGFLGACAICLTPFVRALCHMMVFKLLAALSSAFSQGAAAKVIDGIAQAYSIALGLLGTCCAVQFVSIVVSMVVANS